MNLCPDSRNFLPSKPHLLTLKAVKPNLKFPNPITPTPVHPYILVWLGLFWSVRHRVRVSCGRSSCQCLLWPSHPFGEVQVIEPKVK